VTQALSLAILIAGLAAGVVSMVAGIDQRERGGRRVKYLNLPTFAAAATVFGVVAYPILKYTALGAAAVTAIAASAAAAAAAVMLWVIAGWAVPSASKEVKDPRYALQGHFGRVTGPIMPHGAGEIEYVEDTGTHRIAARSLDGAAIEAGAEVVIERIEDSVAHVERWSKIAQQLELPQ
jgi:membrane protein implicated in regulation of membrane protease activity